MQSNQPRAHTPNHFLYGILYFRSLSICLVTPGPSSRQLGTTLTPQSLLKLFKLDNPKLTLPHLFLPKETTVKTLVQVSPLPL